MHQVGLDRVEGETLVIRLGGRWDLMSGLAPVAPVEVELRREPPPSRVTLDVAELGPWDSSILTFLARVSETCRERGLALDSVQPHLVHGSALGGAGELGAGVQVPEPTLGAIA